MYGRLIDWRSRKTPQGRELFSFSNALDGEV